MTDRSMPRAFIPESAPFTAEQRAWLNGFFAGLLGTLAPSEMQGLASPRATGGSSAPGSAPLATADAAVEVAGEESFAWHDPALPLAERLERAQERPLELRLMAAMAQLDCGACGYVCRTYSAAIARGEEKNLTLCSPGGRETARELKSILKREAQPLGANGHGPVAAESPARAAAPAVNGTAHPACSRQQPYAARLVSSTRLNRPGSAKHTSHVVLDLGDTDLGYRPGDSLGVFPHNCPELVDDILRGLLATGTEPWKGRDGRTATLREALLTECDLRHVDEELVDLLAECADDGCRSELRALREDDAALSSMDLLDLLVNYPTTRPRPEAVVERLAPLAPRLYSIASSPRVDPRQVHLTVARATSVVQGRLRKGVASTMLAERAVPGMEIRVFVQPSHGFALPDDPATPMIMVGPGTGVAPFRAFLQERQATGAPGANWLFFGDQRQAQDFLYEDELRRYLQDGTLTRLDTAFSRDQPHKVYVQHCMRAQGAELFAWLERGAHFFVCGDAQRMAGDVERELLALVAEHGRMPAERAQAYVRELVRQKRYCRDVY